jgi:hypothetical protein
VLGIDRIYPGLRSGQAYDLARLTICPGLRSAQDYDRVWRVREELGCYVTFDSSAWKFGLPDSLSYFVHNHWTISAKLSTP